MAAATTINGQVPLAPHEVSVNPGDGIPSITLTRFETGIPETYHLLPDAASALVSGLIGVTQPPPGEEWTIRKRAPAYPEYHTPEQVRQRDAMASGCDPASVVVGSDRITFRQGETVVVLSRHPDGRWDMSGHRNTEGG